MIPADIPFLCTTPLPAQFCRTHFYGENELFIHMNRSHERCFICLRNKPDEYVYYRNYTELEAHFKVSDGENDFFM